jgi:hypothetical protein
MTLWVLLLLLLPHTESQTSSSSTRTNVERHCGRLRPKCLAVIHIAEKHPKNVEHGLAGERRNPFRSIYSDSHFEIALQTKAVIEIWNSTSIRRTQAGKRGHL